MVIIEKISADKTLKEMAQVVYEEEFIALEIEQIVKKINTLEKEQIPLQDDIIASIQNEMKQLESELVYKTEDEKTRGTSPTCKEKKQLLKT
ncbi:hypothetical protein OL548_20025 [Lysinibacillus sp. MHQ-1]|nr:hypothetical protein OL548_20025 [Lysinibacillus sp. MHQ-1]